MAEAVTIEAVKTACRIGHSVLDNAIADEIEACKKDLETVCGVVIPSEDDPLILKAIKLWCKAAMTDDPAKAQDFRQAYDNLKACLMTASGYGGGADE